MKETEENIRDIEERLKYGHLRYKILESHRKLFELQNSLTVAKNIIPYDDIPICHSIEELAAYCDTYFNGYLTSREEKDRPDSKMLDSQNMVSNLDSTELCTELKS